MRRLAGVAIVHRKLLVYRCFMSALGNEPPPSCPHHPSPTRRVLCDDALSWLKQNAPFDNASFITSLPDVSAFPRMPLEAWKRWFIDAAAAVMSATPDAGVSIFYQTDIKRDHVWIDKGYLCQRAAEEVNVSLLWHKVVCRKPAGEPVFGRPGYTHLLCFSKVPKQGATPYADVLPSTGLMTWSQAMGISACELAVRYVLSHTATRTVVDPFCGVGTVLAVANALGLDSLGVDIANKRVRKARSLTLEVSQHKRGKGGPIGA